MSVPDVAVVVATRNRPDRLAALLEGLTRQTFPAERFEVVVVDDASSDRRTSGILDSAAGRLPLRVLRREQAGGPGAARNDGWRAARAPLVAFTDDDCEVDPRWLEAGVAACVQDDGVVVVQGRTDPMPGEREGPFTRTIEAHGGPYFQTCNMFYPRSLLERLGGFDAESHPRSGEDTDLAWRAKAAGARVVYEPEARAWHAVNRLGPVGMLRVAARWSDSMRVYARFPELRREVFTYGIFWKGTHYLLVRALLALLVPRRLLVLRAWLANPYLALLVRRGRTEGGGPLLAPWYLLHDLVELVAVVRGAVRERRLML